MERREFLIVARLDEQSLDHWIAAGWLMPHAQSESDYLTELDLARAHLIRDLCELGANDEAIPIILDLVDHVHTLRRTVEDLVTGIHRQPEDLRKTFLTAWAEQRGRR